VWRDAVNTWFLRTSGIPDAKGRAGNFPNRLEAEAMTLEGFQVVDVKPWEAASMSKAVQCASPDRRCAASFRHQGQPGWYDLGVQYFDQNDGVSRFKLFVAGQLVDEWAADDTLPTRGVNSHASTRRRIRGLALRHGDEIRLEGVGDGGENAALDYVEVLDRRK